jgi:RNA polymerase sigma-70 factor (ECF subfamily)
MTLPLLQLWFRADDDAADRAHRPQGQTGDQPSAETSRASGQAIAADDASVVARIRAGDAAAFDALYVGTFRELWSFARRYVSETAAEDVVQDVFSRLWERHSVWEVRSTVRAYLFGAVRNRALHQTEHAAVERRASAAAVAEPVDSAVMPSESTADVLVAVSHAVSALPERQRAAMIFRIQRSLSHAEIGDALGVSAAAAGALVRKAEAKLRVALRAYLPDV